MKLSLFPISRRLLRAFLVGAMFFAPFEFLLLEFCAGVFAGQNSWLESIQAGANSKKIRNKVELRPIEKIARNKKDNAALAFMLLPELLKLRSYFMA